MSEDHDDSEAGRFSEHKLLLMIAGSIVVALILTFVSMSLYVTSGAAQVDLSSPSYKSVQKEVQASDKFTGFSASGEINDKALSEFKIMYDKQVKQTTGIDAFGGNVLDDAVLKIDDPALLPEANQ